MRSISEVVKEIAKQFASEFIKNPYFCYIEHGLHAYFFTKLYNALPLDKRYLYLNNYNDDKYKVCVVQKEYPTGSPLGKSRRQNWDIAVIKIPEENEKRDKRPAYDFLRLDSVIEFGMNEDE